MTTVLAAGLVSAVLAPQANSGADMLAKYISTLQGAKSLTVNFTVQQLPSAAVNYQIVFDRSGAAKITTPEGCTLTDGKTYWEYTKSTNEYVERPGGVNELFATLKKDDFLAWAPFFIGDVFKNVSGASVGSKMSMKGNLVTPLTFTLDKNANKTGTIYLDEKTGLAKGAEFKAAKNGDSVDVLILVKDIQIGGALDPNTFAFNPPDGAKKVEISANDLTKWYTNLDEAMKVAKATNRMLFVDMNATWCGPCQMYKREVFPTPEFKAFGKYYVFVDIDTDEQPALAQKFGSTAIPDLHFLKNDGTEVHRVIGFKGMALLDDMKLALGK